MCVNTGCNSCTDPCGCNCSACTSNNCNSCCEDPCQETCGCEFEVSPACIRLAKDYECIGTTQGQLLEDALGLIDSILCGLSTAQDGTDGDSAYEIWLSQGNSGTEQDFLDSLVGPPGADGADGAPGADGADGADGAPGTNGTNGTNGIDGTDGEFGGWSGEWIFDTALTPAAIQPTEIRFDNAVLGAVTNLYINDTNADSTDYDAFLDSFSNTINGTDYFGLVKIWKRFDANVFWYGKVVSVQDNGNYHTIGVENVQYNGTFTDTDNVVVSFVPSGINGEPQLDTGWKEMNDYSIGQGFGLPAYTSGTHPMIRVIGRQVFISGLEALPIGLDQDTGATLVDELAQYTNTHNDKYHIFTGPEGGYDVTTPGAGGFISQSPIVPPELTPTQNHRFGYMQICIRPIRDKLRTDSLVYTTVHGTQLLQTDGRLLFSTLRDSDDSGGTAGTPQLGTNDFVANNLLKSIVTRVNADDFVMDYSTVSSGKDVITSAVVTLEVGREYTILNYEVGDNFSNVGAVLDNSAGLNPIYGLTFIATGTTPTTWTNGSTLLVDKSKPIQTSNQYTAFWDGNDERFMGGILVNFTMNYPIDETLTDAQVLAAWNSI